MKSTDANPVAHAPGSPDAPPRTVAVIDQGIAYGGALVAAATMVAEFDPRRYRGLLVGAVDPSFVRASAPGIEYRQLAHAWDYARAGRWSRWVESRIPRGVRWLARRLLLAGRLLCNVPYMIRLAALLRQNAVDIVHLQNSEDNDEANIVVSMLRIPYVVHTQSGSGRSGFRERFLRRADRVIAISHYMRSTVLEKGVPEERVHVLHNPVRWRAVPEGTRAAMRAQYGFRDADRLVGIVGRVIPWKGQAEFLTAIVPVLEADQRAHAVLVGDAADGGDAYATMLRATAARSSVSDRIHFLGFTMEMDAIYVMLDVLVHASIEPEPFGLVVVEGMCHGLGVIASARGAPPELIHDGIDGFIVDPSDADLLTRRIQSLLADDALRGEVGRRAMARAREEFHPAAFTRSVERIYDDVLR